MHDVIEIVIYGIMKYGMRLEHIWLLKIQFPFMSAPFNREFISHIVAM